MKAIIKDHHCDIVLNEKEVMQLCKPGCGADTCIWLVVGVNGFECLNYFRPNVLVKRLAEGSTVAKRDGCEEIKQFNPFTVECEGEIKMNLI